MPTGFNLQLSDGEAYLVNDALSRAEADRHLDLLRDRIDWRQEAARLFGRSIQIPRLSAWYGTAGYRYSGIMHAPQPLTEELQELQAVVEDLAGCCQSNANQSPNARRLRFQAANWRHSASAAERFCLKMLRRLR